jgi:hypothetical protein
MPPTPGMTCGESHELPQASTLKVAVKMTVFVSAGTAPPYVSAEPSVKVQPIVGIAPDVFAVAMNDAIVETPGHPAKDTPLATSPESRARDWS